ncbi:MAG: 4Fe-4S dicluster domain-containing protein [Thermodesulfobacteriaceae bacterium]|nr:4Fe-4S dicluster domain-containing protein [Thermodesulfobacteriaceae bacterium]
MSRKALLITPELCIGCRACQVACKSWNQLPAEETINEGTHENPTDLTAYTYNRIKFIEKPLNEKGIKYLFVSQRCMHCGEPLCAEVCPTETLFVSEEGAVLYLKERCIGCGLCRKACPYDVPRYDENGEISKCHLCIDRIWEGLEPACAKTCPTSSIKFGEREELINEAKKKGYKIIYGEKDFGGLGVIFALNEPPEVYELP